MSTLPKMEKLKKGYLTKRGEHFKSWKRRWFVLQEDTEEQILSLAYYVNEQETELIGTIDVNHSNGVYIVYHSVDGRENIFELLCPQRTYIFSADTSQQREDWLDILEVSLRRYDIGGGPSKTGYLIKQGMTHKNWKKRWFILEKGLLSYYAKESEKKVLGRFGVRNCTSIKRVDDIVKHPFAMAIATPSRTYYLCAYNEEDLKDWMEALEECIPDQTDAAASVEEEDVYDASDDEEADIAEGDITVQYDDDAVTKPRSSTLTKTVPKRAPSSELPIVMQGFLYKQGRDYTKRMLQRWFILRGQSLTYQKDKDVTEIIGTIDLEQCTGVRLTNKHKLPFSFEVETWDRTYVLQAASLDLCEQWMAALEESVPDDIPADLEIVHPRLGSFLNKVSLSGSTDAEESSDDESSSSSSSSPPKKRVLPSNLNMSKVLQEGYLEKQGGRRKLWQSRWFVFLPDVLLYYKSNKESMPRGIIEVGNITGIEYSNRADAQFCFHIVTPSRTYVISAENETTRTQWVRAIQSVTHLPLIDPAAVVGIELSTSSSVDGNRSGYLEKQGGSYKGWKKRWFILSGKSLAYYKDEKSTSKALGAIDLDSCLGLLPISDEKQNRPYAFELVTPARVYFIAGENNVERASWLRAIADAVPEDPSAFSPAPDASHDWIKGGVLVKEVRETEESHRRRWFVIKDDFKLYCYRSPKDLIQLELFDLRLCTGVSRGHSSATKFAFDVRFPGWTLKLVAPSKTEMDDWVTVVGDAVPEDDAATAAKSPQHVIRNEQTFLQGYLYKQGGHHKSWNKRFFVLRSSFISYSKSSKDQKPMGIILLDSDVNIKEELPLDKPNGFAITNVGRTYYLSADTPEERQAWVGTIKACLSKLGETSSKSSTSSI